MEGIPEELPAGQGVEEPQRSEARDDEDRCQRRLTMPLAKRGDPGSAKHDSQGTGRFLLNESGWDRQILIENSDQYPDKYHGLRDAGFKYLIRSSDGVEELYDRPKAPERHTT